MGPSHHHIGIWIKTFKEFNLSGMSNKVDLFLPVSLVIQQLKLLNL